MASIIHAPNATLVKDLLTHHNQTPSYGPRIDFRRTPGTYSNGEILRHAGTNSVPAASSASESPMGHSILQILTASQPLGLICLPMMLSSTMKR
jgi:hypothetical protein